MSLDRSALITAYRAMYGGGDIEAEQAVRAVELAYAEKQNAELLNALDEADIGNQRLQAWMERIPQQHMRFGVTDSEGKTEMQECTDWCLACKLDKLHAEITEARNACVWLAQIHGHYGPYGSILDHFRAGQYDEAIALIQARGQRRLSRTGPTVIRIVAVEENYGSLDCGDEETAHVWVTVITWPARRAYLTGASPFLNALRAASGTENTPVDLLNMRFIADIPIDPPPDEPGAGEWLEWPGLKLAPSMDEIRNRLGIS